ncbi:MAG: RDD family protein [Elusimicrobia bacterium]|nr:RDD family protein [Elusimicrobiota bacterium]
MGEFGAGSIALAFAPSAAAMLAIAGAFLAFEACCLGLYGTTPLKSLLGLKVVREDGGPLRLWDGVLRTAAYLPSSLLWLGFLSALRREDGRAWHDRLAGTRVVESRERSELESTLLGAGSGVLTAALIMGWLWFAVGAGVYADWKKVTAARQAMRALSRMQEEHRLAFGRYSENISDLAYMTKDWEGFIAELNAVLDLDRDLEMQTGPQEYLIKARARDRRRTPVVVRGPQRALTR